jgi:uncharacterized protein (TIGR02117 family)
MFGFFTVHSKQCFLSPRLISKRWMLVFLALGLLVSACLPSKWSNSREISQKPDDSCVFFVANHGYHTSIILPVRSPVHHWGNRFPHLANGRYLELAWGDSTFYRASGQPLTTALKAALWPTPSVMHVVSFDKPPGRYLPEQKIYKLQTQPQHYKALLAFIKQSFKQASRDQYRYLGKGLYGQSGFYASSQTYHAFYNCNNWVNTALKKAGVQAPLWGGFPFMVTLYL